MNLTADHFTKIPKIPTKRIALHVNHAAQRSLKQKHPWLFDQSITKQSHNEIPGALAVIFDNNRRFLAIGLYDPTSPIRVRILQHHRPAAIDQKWFQDKLENAINIRTSLNQNESPTTGYRLVHGENDGLPGLIIDRYDKTLVLKIYTVAWIPHLHDLCRALSLVFPAERLILRLNRLVNSQKEYLYGLEDGLILSGAPLHATVLFKENGIIFEADPIHGQKTGFFLDQRDNRSRVEKLSAGKSVLNLFSYSGGFSVYAARGGATHITSVDLSLPALQAAKRNMTYNIHHPAVAAVDHTIINQDAFDVLEHMTKNKNGFDLVIIDPPMFAQNQGQIPAALSAYYKLTKLGLGVLNPGGILVQASCSSRVDAQAFFNCIHQAAQHANRPLVDLERTTHALDHPIGFKEGAYLKCLFATVPGS